jgi:hypothetical protein
VSDEKKTESKIAKFMESYLEGAFEGGAPFGLLMAGCGALYGAIQGWTILPPETLNIIQVITAIIGLIVGAFLGFIAGLVGINLFWLAVLFALIYYLGAWLFSG